MSNLSLQLGSGSKAIISKTGASLLELSIDSKKLTRHADDPISIFAGSVLAPWQNRLAKGEYLDQNRILRTLPINEQKYSNALHGMVLTSEFDVLVHTDSQIVLRTGVSATSGYPHNLELTITYKLTDRDFSCGFTATNNSESVAPFVIGFHPYFNIGEPKDVTLTLPAQSYYPQDDNKIPTAKASVTGTKFDFRTGKTLEGVILDDYFTDLQIANGEIVSRLNTADWSLELSQSTNLRHLVVYLKDNYESEGRLFNAIAIEPASGPADAFNSKEDLALIEPGASFSGNWSVRLAAQ